jgi:hypothetical protein
MGESLLEEIRGEGRGPTINSGIPHISNIEAKGTFFAWRRPKVVDLRDCFGDGIVGEILQNHNVEPLESKALFKFKKNNRSKFELRTFEYKTMRG